MTARRVLFAVLKRSETQATAQNGKQTEQP